jgi:hypothetical protein
MPFADINWLAVLVACVVSFVIGFLWFSPKAFYPMWWKAMGKSPDEAAMGSLPIGVVFGLTILAIVVQATGALMGVGFAAATSLSHRLFGGYSMKAWIIEIGQDIVCLAAMGLVLGAWS